MVEAVRELRQLEPGARLDPEGPWMRLVESALAWQGPRVVISMEWMAGCTPAQVEAAVQSLQPARIEVICTTRDLLRMFVAQWQEMTKNCRPWGWQQFVDEVVGDTPGPASRRFWAQQDVPMILQRWAEHVPWDRFHLVTVPPQGADPEVLWDRFCSVLEVDGTAFEQPPRNNESIGVVSASLMHRVNLVAIAEGMDRVEYQRVLHRRLADEVLAPRRGQEAPIAVSPEVDAWIRTRAQQQVDDIRKLDLHVVGDLDELLPGKPLEGREPSDVSDSELLDTCVEAIVKMARAQDRGQPGAPRGEQGASQAGRPQRGRRPGCFRGQRAGTSPARRRPHPQGPPTGPARQASGGQGRTASRGRSRPLTVAGQLARGVARWPGLAPMGEARPRPLVAVRPESDLRRLDLVPEPGLEEAVEVLAGDLVRQVGELRGRYVSEPVVRDPRPHQVEEVLVADLVP